MRLLKFLFFLVANLAGVQGAFNPMAVFTGARKLITDIFMAWQDANEEKTKLTNEKIALIASETACKQKRETLQDELAKTPWFKSLSMARRDQFVEEYLAYPKDIHNNLQVRKDWPLNYPLHELMVSAKETNPQLFAGFLKQHFKWTEEQVAEWVKTGKRPEETYITHYDRDPAFFSSMLSLTRDIAAKEVEMARATEAQVEAELAEAKRQFENITQEVKSQKCYNEAQLKAWREELQARNARKAEAQRGHEQAAHEFSGACEVLRSNQEKLGDAQEDVEKRRLELQQHNEQSPEDLDDGDAEEDGDVAEDDDGSSDEPGPLKTVHVREIDFT
jgi:hypothetical protein